MKEKGKKFLNVWFTDLQLHWAGEYYYSMGFCQPEINLISFCKLNFIVLKIKEIKWVFVGCQQVKRINFNLKNKIKINMGKNKINYVLFVKVGRGATWNFLLLNSKNISLKFFCCI